MIVEIAVFWIISPYFFTVRNFLNIGAAVAVLGIIAAGLTIALVGGILDLSQAPVVALTTVVMAKLTADAGLSLTVAILAAVGVALAVALVNSVVTVVFNVSSIITTLGTGTILGGAAYVITNAQTRTLVAPGFQEFMFRRLAGIPIPLIIMVVVYALGAAFMYATRLGWHVYAVGGNASAATRAGIHTRRIYVLLFVLSALLSCLAGVITAGRSGAGAANLGGDILSAVTAVLLGGISLHGGGGRVERTLAGVLFIGILDNGLILENVQSFWGQIIRGCALILAVVMGAIRDRRMSR